MKLIIRLKAGRTLLATLECNWVDKPGHLLRGPEVEPPFPRIGEMVDVAGYGVARVYDVTYSYMKDQALRENERFLTVVTVNARLL